MEAATDGSRLIVRVSDGGRGVDREAVRERARAMRQPGTTQAELSAAIIHDGLTTRSNVSEFSGRGVGLAALAEVVSELGGRLSVESEQGRGTTMIFTFEDHASTRGVTAPRSRERWRRARSSSPPAHPEPTSASSWRLDTSIVTWLAARVTATPSTGT